MIKYVLHPGYVINNRKKQLKDMLENNKISGKEYFDYLQQDIDPIYISVSRLLILYDVKLNECLIADNKIWYLGLNSVNCNKLIHLYPRSDGKYPIFENSGLTIEEFKRKYNKINKK